MLATLFGGIFLKALPALVGAAFPQLKGLFADHEAGRLTEAELKTRLAETLAETSAKVEIAEAEAQSKNYAALMTALPQSRVMQAVWAAVAISQLLVLLWYQWVVPFGAFKGWWVSYPSAGATVDWAYFLLAGMLAVGLGLKGRR